MFNRGAMFPISKVTTKQSNSKPRSLPNKLKAYSKTCADTLMKFCSNSSIHGLRYITLENCRSIERIWWVVSIGLSVYLCTHSIHELWMKWNDTPVIKSYSHYLDSISKIPFPAMTVCPLAKISLNKFNYTRAYRTILKLDGDNGQNITNEDLIKLRAAAQICDDFFVENILEKFPENDADKSFVDSIKEIASGFEENIVACNMMGRFSTCYEYFNDILVEEGICFAFNLLGPSETTTETTAGDLTKLKQDRIAKHWHFKTGYEPINHTKPTDEYPYRTFSTGKFSSFKVILKVMERNRDYLCTGPTQGFKVSFHTPFEIPQVWKKHFHIAPKQSANFLVTPNVVVSADSLRMYHPQTRQCFFQSERSLKFFRKYTQVNCELECLSNYTLGKCGCVKFSMARNDQIKICGSAKIQCCTNVESDVIHRDILRSCMCLPACNSISYDVTVSESNFHLDEVWRRSAMNGHIDVDNSSFSQISISFKDPHFRAIKRSELYSAYGFFAYCGNLFSLCMGASVLSVIEIFYYFIFRVSPEQKKQMKRFKKTAWIGK